MFLRRFVSSHAILVALVSAGCANAGGIDGGAGGTDGGDTPRMDGGAARRDAGSTTMCEAGQHMCGGGCIDDLPNMPANGCRFGCGEPCPTPPDGAASCDADGACAFDCPPPFRREGDACVCAPMSCADRGYACGAPDDGCGTTLDCGACASGTCMEGVCGCPEDAQEPNDRLLNQKDIGDASDAPDTTLNFDMFNLHDADDEDWFSVDIEDGTDGGNPNIRVTLDGIPAGSDYELSAYYVCTAGGDASDCVVGSPCSGRASGTTSETVTMGTSCSTTDDSGRLYIHITSVTWGGSCAPYTLEVAVR